MRTLYTFDKHNYSDDMDITSAETKATYGEGNCGGIEAF